MQSSTNLNKRGMSMSENLSVVVMVVFAAVVLLPVAIYSPPPLIILAYVLQYIGLAVVVILNIQLRRTVESILNKEVRK